MMRNEGFRFNEKFNNIQKSQKNYTYIKIYGKGLLDSYHVRDSSKMYNRYSRTWYRVSIV